MKTKDAIKHLTEQLKSDSGYYYSWQANIAMQFKDGCARAGINFPQLHEIANQAAKDFIDLLCKSDDPTKESEAIGE